MKKVVFYYIILNILFLQIEQLQHTGLEFFIQCVCVFFILTVGVSHGAIDNVLYGIKGKMQNVRFITIYVLIALLAGLTWFFLPNFSFITFLLISAYHFGQSQFVDYNLDSGFMSRVLYFCWGGTVLSFLIHFNRTELLSLTYEGELFPIVASDFLIENSAIFTYGLVSVSLAILVYLIFLKNISFQALFTELYLLVLIALSFKFLSILLGFSLYFIILHSFRVLIQEYDFLKKNNELDNNFQFVKILLPFTIAAILGLGGISLVLYLNDAILSIPIWALIVTFGITLPHALVMEIFYRSDSYDG